jgi:hypothetical protein
VTVAEQHSEPSAVERRWTRGAWLVVGAMVLYTLCELLVFRFAVTRPTDGCLIEQGTDEAQVIQSCIGDWPTPLRPDDEVLQVSGHSLFLDLQDIDLP